MSSYLRFFALSLLLIIAPASVTTAQQESLACPQVVEQALAQAGESCANVKRNEACYGNPLLEATFREAGSALSFSTPSDQVPVNALDTLRTFPMDPDSGVWGVGVMRIQANLPDVRPGEVVTFLLYGDVTLQNAGADAQPSIPEPCRATVLARTRARTGPGAGFEALGALDAGATVSVTGRDAAGAWVRAETRDGLAWLPADALDRACDMAAFPVFDANGPTTYGPMQAFYFTSGFGEPLCHEVPPSSLVVQSPAGVHVAFSVNGVSVTVGSTIVLQAARDQALIVTTLQGEAAVRAQGASRRVPPGFQTTVPLGGANGLEPQGPPTPIEPADLEAFAALTQTPPSLLSEPITVPGVEAVEAQIVDLCRECLLNGTLTECPADCEAVLCNGICDGTDCITCLSDCRDDQCYWCGNGTCDPIEDAASCPGDCDGETSDDGKLCGDEICQGHESAETCPQDCGDGKLCGDGVCQGHESAEACPQDCGDGKLCGDGVCQGHESPDTCPQDCTVGKLCGDGVCQGNEDAATCPQDCG